MRFRPVLTIAAAALVLACVRPAAADDGALRVLDELARFHAESGVSLSAGSSLPDGDPVATDASVKVGIQILPLLPLLGVTSRTNSLNPRFVGELRLYPLFLDHDGFQPFAFAGFDVGKIDVRSTAPDGRTFSESVRSNAWKLGGGLEYRFEQGLALGGSVGPYATLWDASSATVGAGKSYGVTTSIYAAWTP